jgi:hypothetical protein
MFRERAGAREVRVIGKGGESFELERCMAAHDGRAWRVPAINMLSFL